MSGRRTRPEHAEMLAEVTTTEKVRAVAVAAADDAIERALLAGIPAAAVATAAGMTPGALRMALRRDRARPADHRYRRWPNLGDDQPG